MAASSAAGCCDDSCADGLRHAGADQRADQVHDCGHRQRDPFGQRPHADRCGDGVGRVVEAFGEVEYQRHGDDGNERSNLHVRFVSTSVPWGVRRRPRASGVPHPTTSPDGGRSAPREGAPGRAGSVPADAVGMRCAVATGRRPAASGRSCGCRRTRRAARTRRSTASGLQARRYSAAGRYGGGRPRHLATSIAGR
jgi:hypothetical protein